MNITFNLKPDVKHNFEELYKSITSVDPINILTQVYESALKALHLECAKDNFSVYNKHTVGDILMHDFQTYYCNTCGIPFQGALHSHVCPMCKTSANAVTMTVEITRDVLKKLRTKIKETLDKQSLVTTSTLEASAGAIKADTPDLPPIGVDMLLAA